MNLKLKIWRQKNANSSGEMVDYNISDVSPDMSFLEMMDVLNNELISKDQDPISFDHDCEEFVECVQCILMVDLMVPMILLPPANCMRKFKDGDTIIIEPFRADAFPVIKDLVVDRSAFDRIQQAGGFVSINTSGNTQDANTIPIAKENADKAFDATTIIVAVEHV